MIRRLRQRNTGRTRSPARYGWALLLSALWLMGMPVAQGAAPARVIDARLRDVPYSADEVYRLTGHVGYAVDLQFEAGEHFVGLGSGDVEGISIAAETNHLFIKPRAPNVRTNLIVLTSRRIYHFDYVTLPHGRQSDAADVVYALRFLYPPVKAPPTAAAGADPARTVQTLLARGSTARGKNTDYWYCGSPQLRPTAAWDDGVQTHMHFDAAAELPALFVLNDDGSEALVDFHIERTDIVAHRIARRFVLRRGLLVGCVVNRGFRGSGVTLPSGTISPQVQRRLQGSATHE